MKNLLKLILILIPIFTIGQDIENGIYFGEKGFLPGSLTIILEINSDTVSYEIYNHYYTKGFYEIKKGELILSENLLNINDSIQISIKRNNSIVFNDKSLKLKKILRKNKNISHINYVRNLAFADKKSRLDTNINRWELYNNSSDLLLNPSEFCFKVDSIYNILTNKE